MNESNFNDKGWSAGFSRLINLFSRGISRSNALWAFWFISPWQRKRPKGVATTLCIFVTFATTSIAADWPMWRGDPGRTATSPQSLKSDLSLKWVRTLPALEPAYKDVRLQFDAGYEPIAFGKRIFIGSSHDNSVSALDADNGKVIWKYYSDGPIRFAPVGGKGRVLFGSDDGWFYCLKASSGDLVWKYKAVPLERKLLGNSRLISVWPIRGGPVLHEDKVYFAAGVWPLEGVFVYCLDAATGKVVWLNDSSSYIYGQHPHNTEAFGGLAPQGYLLVDGDDLVVPSSNAYPARFDLKTGKLKDFQLPTPGRLTGGWFAASLLDKDTRRGVVVFDSSVNQKRHEDKLREEGKPDIRNKITLASEDFLYAREYPGVEGSIYSAVAADGNLVISTKEGNIYCFGEAEGETIHYSEKPPQKSSPAPVVARLVKQISQRKGYAVLFHEPSSTAEAIADHSGLHVISIHPDKVTTRRSDPGAAKLSYRVGQVDDYELPPWFCDLVLLGKGPTEVARLQAVFESVRPYGGILIAPKSMEELAVKANLQGAQIKNDDPDYLYIHRSGALQGATNYLGGWEKSPDALVKAPLGILWFGDQTSHFKRSPQPKFVNGVMISIDKDWTDASTRSGKVDYRLLPPTFSDVYTGRSFEEDEVPELRQSFSKVDQKTIQPSQYRPPKQGDDWKPDAPTPGTRKNPLTGEEETRTFPKMYGCDGGLDYGNLYTMRSGTAAFYDLQNDSGTINISGPRSGCTNSIIPANGVLNLPYFYEGCTCSYPLPMGLSLFSMPETFEQWMSWGKIPAGELAGKIERIGINFGAPGDRRTDDGTLWLDFPDKGGPSPEIIIKTDPEQPDYLYRHSLWMKPDEGTWPWVAASAATNLKSVTISGFKAGVYDVGITFTKFDKNSKLPASFTIGEEKRNVSNDLKSMSGTTIQIPRQKIDGELTIQFSSEATISGIEVKPAES